MAIGLSADVAIVGGGVIGCSIAYHLALSHAGRIVLLERHSLASGATGICPGGIRQQFEREADCRLARHSVRFFERINDVLAPDAPFFFERSGYLFLADSPDALERFRRNVRMQNRIGIPSQLLTRNEVAELVPRLTLGALEGGAFCAEDGFIEDCHGVTRLLAARARGRGARITYAEVTALQPSGGAWRITTATGPLEAGHVVLAAGADSVSLAAGVGLDLPIRKERRRLLYTLPTTTGLMAPLVAALERGVAGRQLRNGMLYMGWLHENEATDDLTFIERTLEAGSTLLPLVADLPVRRILSGSYDTTPDRRPILGGVAGLPGLWLAVGFSGHGFMIAPSVGEILAGCITGRASELPVEEFSLGRFAGPWVEEGLVV